LNAEYLFSKKFSTSFDYRFLLRNIDNEVQTSSGKENIGDPGSSKNVVLQDHRFDHRLRYHVTPKTFAFMGAGYGFTKETSGSSRSQADSKYLKLSGGLEGRLTAKSVISLDAGAEVRNFENPSQTDWRFVAQAAYLVRFTEKWHARLTFIQDREISITPERSFFNTTKFDFDLHYKPTDKIESVLTAAFQMNDFDPSTAGSISEEDSSDYTFEVDTVVSYRMKNWLNFFLRYNLEIRNSSTFERDYLSHMATFGVDIGGR